MTDTKESETELSEQIDLAGDIQKDPNNDAEIESSKQADPLNDNQNDQESELSKEIDPANEMQNDQEGELSKEIDNAGDIQKDSKNDQESELTKESDPVNDIQNDQEREISNEIGNTGDIQKDSRIDPESELFKEIDPVNIILKGSKNDPECELSKKIDPVNDIQNDSRKEQLITFEIIKIFHIVQTRKFEFDCLGTSIYNLKFGTEVVHGLKQMLQSYAQDSREEFKANLNKEIKRLMQRRNMYLKMFKNTKGIAAQLPHEELRDEILEDVSEVETLLVARIESFKKYFGGILKQHVHIANDRKIVNELKDVDEKIMQYLSAVCERRRTVLLASEDDLTTLVVGDINRNMKKLSNQAENISKYLKELMGETKSFKLRIKAKKSFFNGFKNFVISDANVLL